MLRWNECLYNLKGNDRGPIQTPEVRFSAGKAGNLGIRADMMSGLRKHIWAAEAARKLKLAPQGSA